MPEGLPSRCSFTDIHPERKGNIFSLWKHSPDLWRVQTPIISGEVQQDVFLKSVFDLTHHIEAPSQQYHFNTEST